MPTPPLHPGLVIIQGNQAERLREILVNWQRNHPLPPLEDEVILVQSNGIAQWLKFGLATAAKPDGSGGCGIATALDLCLPARFLWRAYRAVLGPEAVPEVSPFDRSLLLWRLMRLLPGLIEGPGYEPLARFLDPDPDLRRRHQLADKLADLFDQYQVYRADWLEAWACGDDTLPGEQPLAPEHAWQPRLWRALVEDAGQGQSTSRAAIHRRFLEQAQGLSRRPPELPRRLSVFGLSSVPRQTLEVLIALSAFTQVLFCVHNPCQYHWTETDDERDLVRRASRPGHRPLDLDDPDLHLLSHPLLAAWGKQGRDYIALLENAIEDRSGTPIDLFDSPGHQTLLNQLQDDILALRPMAESRGLWPALDPVRDRSIQFHLCHSPQREIEVLHDQLLAAFDADPTLHPRDILVMVPCIDDYIPSIEAVFGAIDRSDRRHIPFSIADRAQRRQSPPARALEYLLTLPEARLTTRELFDLLDVPALSKRFGIDPDDLPTLRRWIRDSGIRWGLDDEHRAQCLGVRPNPIGPQNSWALGLKRLLLGYACGAATGEDSAWHELEPFDEVTGLQAALVGPLARLLGALTELTRQLAQPTSPARWGECLNALLTTFFEADEPAEEALLEQLQVSLDEWVDCCAAAGLEEPLPLAVIRTHWLGEIDRPALSQPFLGGRLTFATLMPMRAIPFRRVCLLGMNDGDYPRTQAPMDFDLMARHPRPGDRSRREDDRTLFLEALLSAREALSISWVGRNIRDNSVRPPSVLVGQLRDHLEAVWTSAPAHPPLLEALTVEHRLHPFSPAYFGTTPMTSSRFTYAREWQPGAPTPSAIEHGNGLLDPPDFAAPISWTDLAHFLKNPPRWFLNRRLGVYFSCAEPGGEDHEPFSLDGLERWILEDGLIQAGLGGLRQGHDPAVRIKQGLTRSRRSGQLPLGQAARALELELLEAPQALLAAYQEVLSVWPQPVPDRDVRHDFCVEGQPITCQGPIGNWRGGDRGAVRIDLCSSHLVSKGAYRLDPLLGSWVLHLAAQRAMAPLTTVVIGKDGAIQIDPIDPDQARTHLTNLVNGFVAGHRRPLPVVPRTAAAHLGKPESAAQCYQGDDHHLGEVQRDPHLQRCYPDFDALTASGEFDILAQQLYAPLRAALHPYDPGTTP